MTASTCNIDFVIFDCDGVLIDSEILSMQVWAQLLSEYTIHIDQAYFFKHFLGRSFEHVQSVIQDKFNFIVSPELAERFAEELKQIFEHRLTPTAGIKDVIKSLSVPYCLATSSSRARTHIALGATGLDAYFTEKQIFTASEVRQGKPAPDLFLHAARQRQFTPSRCLVIEDSAPGIQAANSAGMHWLHYTGASHMRHLTGNVPNALAHWRDFKTCFPQLINS